jgi:hypothetical protein
MLRGVAILLAFAFTLRADLWPDRLDKYERKSTQPVEIAEADRARWNEYGLEAAEQAEYGAFQVTGWRFKDSTGAFAAALNEPVGKPVQAGNYLIRCAGRCPKNWTELAKTLPHFSHRELPILQDYLPDKGLVARSQRYVLGPAGLSQFAPSVPASAVNFQFDPEGAIGRYRSSQGELTLAIFAYPTPEMARSQMGAFQAAGGMVKRSGPLLAVIPSPPDAHAAEGLLKDLTYQASLSWSDPVPIPVKPESVAQMLLSIFTLTGIVLAFCILSGVAFGGLRMLQRKFGKTGAEAPMILLNLEDK